MREVALVGAGMTRFGKYLDRNLKDLAREAVESVQKSAGVDTSAIEAAVVANAAGGLVTGQHQVRGQVVLRELGIGDIPVINAENACASSATAFHLAWLYVASGMYDCVLALGMEKVYHEDPYVPFAALDAAGDVELTKDQMREMKETLEAGGRLSGSMIPLLPLHAERAQRYIDQYGASPASFAEVVVKNRAQGALNPKARVQKPTTVEEVLAAPMAQAPLTTAMVCPLGDGAAAAIVVSPEKARQLTTHPIWVAASVINSGKDIEEGEPNVVARSAKRAYEMAGVEPADLDVLEMHDLIAHVEIMGYEDIGLCGQGEGWKLAENGHTRFGGKQPVNPSGGFLAKGDPFGAVSLGQITEIFQQLRGEAEQRQVEGAKLALAQNSGGLVRGDFAATAVHIFKS